MKSFDVTSKYDSEENERLEEIIFATSKTKTKVPQLLIQKHSNFLCNNLHLIM